MIVNKIKIFILIFMRIYISVAFNVHFHETYVNSDESETRDIDGGIQIVPYHEPTVINKRDTTYFYDKASYTFNGLEKIESVPVPFPIDICLMSFNGSKYATALHKNKAGIRHFTVFKMQNNNYRPLMDSAAPLAVAMDCRAFGERGFVAVAYNITQPVRNAKAGSPIYKITGDRVRAVQYFAAANLVSMYLRITGNELMLLQTFRNSQATPNLQCPCFVWSGSTFNRMGSIPCSNARHLEPFAMDYESYVAVANYADQRGRSTTNSEVYKFNKEKRQFQLLQRIKTYGAIDVRFFSVPYDEVRRQHFLVFGNSLSSHPGKNQEADSIFYVYEKGQFVPYQRLSLYAVAQFLPVENADAEKFLLFVASSHQDVKIYNLNDWKFEESRTQFTEGALSRGVSNMRIYHENDESYLVIANELMSDVETNVFRPIFKQEEHANMLRQQIIDWSKATTKRLLQFDVQQLSKDVEAKLSRTQSEERKLNLNITTIPSANIKTAITKSLIYPRLKLNANYWLALSYANQALDALQVPPAFTQQMRIRRDTADELESLNVGTLHVHNKLQAQRMNGIEVAQPEFQHINAKKVIVTSSYNNSATRTQNRQAMSSSAEEPLDMLNVQNLYLTGTINDLSLSALFNETLKRTATQQTISAPLSVSQLHADIVNVVNNKLNGKSISQLVRIDSGDYKIQQDVQFIAPVRAQELWVYERLNNLQVRSYKFDALLRQSNETQIVEGAKRFESLRLLQPINVAGPLLGKYLKAISPINAIHEDLVLHGDYIISGDVHISKLLNADELIEETTNTTVSSVLKNGLHWDESLENVNLEFVQPLTVDNCHVSYVNKHDLQHLVKLNWKQPQVIEGRKIFENDLKIREGFGEVRYLNGIDVEALEQQLLLRNTNQNINITLQVGKLLARSVKASQLTLNGSDVSAFLTKSTKQSIRTPLKVHKLTAQILDVLNLNTNGLIFGQPLNLIYQQKSRNAPLPHLFQRNRKFHGTIHVKDLQVNGNTATINGRPLQEIERQLTELGGDIKYVGSFKFNHDLSISNLTFTGNLNGISAHEFGHCWLQHDGAQEFSTPQTFANVLVSASSGVQLNGKLNGVHLNDFYMNALWINRDEYIEDAYFENPTQLRDVLAATTINGLRVPGDMLYRNSPQPQILESPTVVGDDLQLRQGSVSNMSTLNGIDLFIFNKFLNGYENDYQTLHLEHAHFDMTPRLKTLNKYDLQQTLDTVWLANENVNLQLHVEIADAEFQGLLELEGPINNMHLTYLKENYFSLSRPQSIDVNINFVDAVKLEAIFNVEHLYLTGPIIESIRGRKLDFNDFVYHTLKTAGSHTISGFWQLKDADLKGDLRDVQINDLNLEQDILRCNLPYPIPIGNKVIASAEADTLHASSTSIINKINVTHWVRNAVYLHSNQTIKGSTHLDFVRLYDDLKVDGQVNNISFNAGTLLLRDHNQYIRGDVSIRNKFPQQRILANNFDNLQAELINDWNITEFLANKATISPTLQVHSHLIFQQPLIAHSYETKNTVDKNMKSKWKRSDINKLSTKPSDVKNQSTAVSHYLLGHFELRQILNIYNATYLLPINLHYNGELIKLLCVHNVEGNFTFYRWNRTKQQFTSEKVLTWLPRQKLFLQILNTLPIITKQQHTAYPILTGESVSAVFKSLQEEVETQCNNALISEPMFIQKQNCFALYERNASEVKIICFAIDWKSNSVKVLQRFIIPRQNVKQMLPLNINTLALLFDDAVEIWNISYDNMQALSQLHLASPNSKHMSSIKWHDHTYLAIVSESLSKRPHVASVEMYISLNDSYENFNHMQTLEFIKPIHVAFSPLYQSDDLLLHVITTVPEQLLQIFHYQGISGFQPLLCTSSIRTATKHVQNIALLEKNQQFLALLDPEQITLVEIVFEKLFE